MPVKDIISNIEAQKAEDFTVAANGTLQGATAIDTADFGEGVGVVANCTAYTDGSHVLGFEDSADGSTDWQAVSGDKVILAETVSAVTTDGDILKKAGVFSTRRYLRPTVVSTGVTTGASISVIAVKCPEILPA